MFKVVYILLELHVELKVSRNEMHIPFLHLNNDIKGRILCVHINEFVYYWIMTIIITIISFLFACIVDYISMIIMHYLQD